MVIAEWSGENVVRTQDGRELGVWMGSPQLDALDKICSCLAMFHSSVYLLLALPYSIIGCSPWWDFLPCVFQLYISFGCILWEIFEGSFLYWRGVVYFVWDLLVAASFSHDWFVFFNSLTFHLLLLPFYLLDRQFSIDLAPYRLDDLIQSGKTNKYVCLSTHAKDKTGFLSS